MYEKLYKDIMSNLIAISDARAKLPELVSDVHDNTERAIITVNGQPKAVLLSFEELESLEETAEVLTIPNVKKDIAKSRKQFNNGQYTLLEDLK